MWKESYRIGIDIIDRQHRQLFDTIDKLWAALELDDRMARAETAVDTIHFMHGYFEEHFAAEEAHMEQAGYPDLEEHRKQHQAFIFALTDVENRIYDTAFNESMVRIYAKLLQAWLANHVLVSDQKIVAKGAADTPVSNSEQILRQLRALAT